MSRALIDAPANIDITLRCPVCGAAIVQNFAHEAPDRSVGYAGGWIPNGSVEGCPKGCEWPAALYGIMDDLAQAQADAKGAELAS